MHLLTRITTYAAMARRVKAEHGVPVIHQISDILRLACGPGRIGPGDYYLSRIFDPSLSSTDKSEFVGWKAEARLDRLNESTWHCLGLDKVLMYSLFRSNGIRIPETRAIYLPGRIRTLTGAVALDTSEALQDWLRTPSNYPFFSKPSSSGFGRAAFWAEAYDANADRITLKSGSSIQVDDFPAEFRDVEHLGYLFQTPLQPDQRLVPSLGRTISSLRMVVLFDEEQGPLLHRSYWKLPTGNNMVDNFNGGRTGNLAAAIDQTTGQIVRVINGTGLDLAEVERHPDTGVLLKTLSVPDWGEVLDFTLGAALTLPKIRFQQWDVALSSEGPVALEVNLFGNRRGCDLAQLLYHRGLLDATMQAFLARHRL